MKINFRSNFGMKTGNPIFQYLSTITATLTILSGAMHYGWSTPSLPKLQASDSPFSVSSSEGSWIAVMMLFGGAAGSILGACVVDVIGRKKVILLTSFPFFTAWIMIAYSTSIEVLYTARFIAGLADGITFTVVPMYLGEIANPKIRGLLGSSCAVIFIFGILLVNVMGIFLDFALLALIASVVPVMLLLTFIWMPESPYFLIMKNDFEEAKKSLRILRGNTDYETEIEMLTCSVKAQSLNRGSILDLFTVRSNRASVLILFGLRTIQQLSGISPITFYANIIFEQAGQSLSANIMSAIYFSIQCVMTVISSILLDKTGRKPLLFISLTGSALCLFIEASYYYINTKIDISNYSAVPVTAIILFVITYSIGLGTVPVLMLGELLPTNVKAVALCLVEIYYSIIATLASKFFQIMIDDFDMSVPCFTFGGCCVLGLIFVYFGVPETKGKTLEDIQEYLKGQSNIVVNKKISLSSITTS